MKRAIYVDQEGNTVNQDLEHKRPLLNLFFCIGTIIPIILIVMIVITVVQNNTCINLYNNIKTATLAYLKDQGELPDLEGENTVVNIADLYSAQYLNSNQTTNILCSGNVKVTKYKKDYIYTLDVRNCDKCSTNKKYGSWSSEQTFYPRNKAIIDVIPYYNYYERQLNTTSWTRYFDKDELADEISQYDNNLPLDENELPEVPKESEIVEIQSDSTYYYRYRDKSWKWYDIVGNYSDFSSEMPQGFTQKDQDTEVYSKWSDYSLDYPEEKDYRTIEKQTGYKFYYTDKNGKKRYYNSGKYSVRDEVNTEKYDQTDEETSTLYRYRDKQWRWYNGQKRRYSLYYSSMPSGMPYCDLGTETLSNPSNWEAQSRVNDTNRAYRLEEKKPMTRFRTVYEILSLKVLEKPLNHEAFEKKVQMTVPEFFEKEDAKLEITYKFKYKKS